MPTSIQFENKSARILHIGLGGSEFITIPPREEGGGTTVTVDDAEKERLDKALATPTVKQWIDDGELVMTEGAAEPPPEDAAAKRERAQTRPEIEVDPMADAAKPRSQAQPQPERKGKHGFFGGGEKDHKGEP